MPTFTNPDSVHRASTGAIAPATWGDTVNDDINFLYGDTAWTAPTFANSWVNAGGTNLAAGFRKIGTRVALRGQIKSGTVGAVPAFTLPTGYRPTGDCGFAVVSNSLFGYVFIQASTGNVEVAAGSNVFVDLDGITFDTI